MPTLIVSSLVKTITCSAEIGGTALVLHLLTGWSHWLLAIFSTLLLVAIIWLLPFKWIERSFGLLGLAMICFAVATVQIHPDWLGAAAAFVPQIPHGLRAKDLVVFAYFAVAIVSAVMFPYETYFYSSGGIEENWKPKDLKINRLTLRSASAACPDHESEIRLKIVTAAEIIVTDKGSRNVRKRKQRVKHSK